MVKTKDNILTEYQNDVKAQHVKIDNLKRRLNKISFSRLGLFVAEILIVALIINTGFSWLLGALTVIPLIVFAFLVKKQTLTQDALTYETQLLWVYQNEADHLLTGKNKYNNGKKYADEFHPYSSDLDIFGGASLYAFVNRCNTSKGMDILAKRLGGADAIENIQQRQEAISELALNIRESFRFRAELQNHRPEQLLTIENKLKHQLPEQLEFTHNKFLRFFTVLIPYLSTVMFIAGVLVGGLVWKFLLLLGLFNAACTLFFLRRVTALYNGFSGSSASLNSFASAVKWTEETDWKSSYIRGFFNQEKGAVTVSLQIKRLAAIIQSFDARLNIFIGGVLNLFFLWDLRHAVKLDMWYLRSSEQLMQGLYRINQFEELISFATLHYNHPDWNFPALEHTFQFEAKDLGHPLIPEQYRVVNDFSLAADPTADIITGSNMAGKSTFLRTVGINMVLAFAGAPVCAAELRLSIFHLLSYMRIKDSLNDQTSTFKAELNRLKMILDAVVVSQVPFVLIDEMLRGTNSKDKYLGSKVFIERLVSQNTPVLFATHDLQLSEMETTYPGEIRNYHFDIQISDGEMEFDYKLKHGPCRTFNAALLLQQIGLTVS